MADARDLLRTLAAEDRRGAVFCAALCAASVAHLVPVGERRPWRAVRLALAWGMGVQVPRERLRNANDAANAASNAAYAAAAAASADAAVLAAYAFAEAASAAAASADAAADAAADAEAAADIAAVAYAAVIAAVASADAGADGASAASNQARVAHLARLHALVLHQITPIAPTPTDVRRATPSAQVAWDRLIERCPDPVRTGTLGDALARARKARLRWTCPVERAIAERCDEAHLIELLATLRGRRPRYGVDARVPDARPHASSKARIGPNE